jgi:hypothetical protein
LREFIVLIFLISGGAFKARAFAVQADFVERERHAVGFGKGIFGGEITDSGGGYRGLLGARWKRQSV